MNIFEKLAKITEELQTVAKNLTVSTGSGNGYKAVSERDIIDAVKPLEAKYGVYSYPSNREVLESQMLSTETKYGVKTSFFSRIKTTYRFVNCEKPEEYIETVTFAEGIDAQDKGSGKAMTYADKYALMKAYKISTGEDPDAEASEPTDYSPANEPIDSHMVKTIMNMCQEKGVDSESILKAYKVESLGMLNKQQGLNVIRRLESK